MTIFLPFFLSLSMLLTEPYGISQIDTLYTEERGSFILLADGSSWKIADEEKFPKWEAGDWIHLSVTPGYCLQLLKKDRYQLVNETKNQEIDVACEHLSEEAVTILSSVRVLTDYSVGGIGEYIKLISLNDGSLWTIKSNISHFTQGSKVMIGFNREEKKIRYYMVTPYKEGLIWTSARPFSYPKIHH